ncbi:MAG: linear amide C-N hydrolase [Verrucomicrobia bacterium]|nr:linear amide C-N hydrolase [Verrucomicrobiota bacterium]MBU1736159.1 linear amide C-N hydrolase [Verrucomicrobiota bacterium]MBU1856759.1 linear amide C-N hydrolase [Verrucomicrobiota bacterium]
MKAKSIRLRTISLVCTVLLYLSSSSPAFPCTWFRFFSDTKNPFIGRTMEWPGDLQAEIALFPRGHSFGTYTTKYGFVGIHHLGSLSDGLNEHGLAVSGLWLSESKYADKSKAQYHIKELVSFLLGNAKTVDEALKIVEANQFYTSKMDGKIEITLHFAITDASGRSVVVEFIDGKTKVYENEVGVMTNEPAFDKHLQMWSAYNPRNFNENTFEGFDYSPEGRFARMAAFNATQTKVVTDEAAINRAWSMLNTVDIPQGILYWRWVSDNPQFTSYAVVVDIKNRAYYFRTYDNYDIRKVDLSKIDFSSVKYSSATLFGYVNYQEFKFK